MFNAFDPKGGASESGGRDRAERAPEPQPLDREVPIAFAATPAGVHEWLDGDLAESDVRRADTARHVEFWNRLNADAAVRRQVKTPAHVQAQIMAAIAPQAATRVEPWYAKGMTITPITAVVAAAGLLAAGALVTMLFV